MPKVIKSKRADPKSTPYSIAPPPVAGPSTITTSSASLSKKEKKERKKARRSSLALKSSASAVEDLLPVETSSSLPIPPTQSSAARTDSAATATTVASDATAPAGSPATGKKKKNKKNKRKESLLSQSMTMPKIEAVDLPKAPKAEPGAAPVQAHPQPGAIAMESSEDVVARLTAKLSRKEKNRVKVEFQPSQAGSSIPSEPAPKKLKLLKESKVPVLEKRLEEAREEAEREKAKWEKEREETAAKLKESEEKLEAKGLETAQKLEEKEKDIAKNVKILETLREAATCGVCLDYFKDPHILACGHIACKACLTSWFRTPAAFQHRILDLGDNLVPDTRDVSYRTKMCHTCRVPIFRRPSRMYHFDSILEPLGINPQIPTLSQDRETVDPWRNLFPRERDSYRVHDDDGHIERCPECNAEIDDNVCEACDIEFSESEEEEDMLSEGSEIGDGTGIDGGGSEDDEDEDEGELPGLDDLLNPVAAAALRARAEAAARARVDRQILEQERRIRDQRNLMDLEADGDGEDDDDDEEGDPWGGRADRMGYEDNEADDSNDEVVQMHRQEYRNGDLYDEDDSMLNESYESSFIDDDDEEEVEEIEGAKVVEDSETEETLEVGEQGLGMEEELDAEQMRQKRLAWFDAKMKAEEPARSESPVLMRAPASSRRRAIVDSDSE